jgi:hypothetical protein
VPSIAPGSYGRAGGFGECCAAALRSATHGEPDAGAFQRGLGTSLRQSPLEGNPSICGVMLTASWRNEIARGEHRLIADRRQASCWRTVTHDCPRDGRAVLDARPRPGAAAIDLLAMHRLVMAGKCARGIVAGRSQSFRSLGRANLPQLM